MELVCDALRLDQKRLPIRTQQKSVNAAGYERPGHLAGKSQSGASWVGVLSSREAVLVGHSLGTPKTKLLTDQPIALSMPATLHLKQAGLTQQTNSAKA